MYKSAKRRRRDKEEERERERLSVTLTQSQGEVASVTGTCAFWPAKPRRVPDDGALQRDTQLRELHSFTFWKEQGRNKCRRYDESEYHGQPAFTAVPWRWNNPPRRKTNRKQRGERERERERGREKPVPFSLPQ
ncbi:hypothetical protein EYF80_002035 [Liparis tanakae]|uniref:Uncharacterized protein n=1 Tax=Liparis tanakae TaxID=230148 RepID=A0A4Z2JDF9_9TELE|nr:hypothetical protein EYF80_002035 [Liparis tanakae]